MTAGCSSDDRPDKEPVAWPDAFAAADRLGRGVNLGNALEAPIEGQWGVTITPALLDAVHDAGFDSVRIPVKWSAHAALDAPYTIDPAFFERIDDVVAQAAERGLVVVLNMHHYDELNATPDLHRERYLALWRQIAERYAARPSSVYFELLNEPNGELTAASWNALALEALAVVRETNPRRTVIVGGGGFNHVLTVRALDLPADGHLIATFHYYEPFTFTHQGAEWVPGSELWLGTEWTGSDAERAAIEQAFAGTAEWAAGKGIPLLMGEFGAYSTADIASRVRWTDAVARTAERHGITWAYWEFAAGFGIWDPGTGAWQDALRTALLPDPNATAPER
ncbi:MAG: glycoside hydrolase family 5 protein [Chloroflexi bacterium]|nr:glycoside hydrolase family 5 protein [Chloroflexota bacterium]